MFIYPVTPRTISVPFTHSGGLQLSLPPHGGSTGVSHGRESGSSGPSHRIILVAKINEFLTGATGNRGSNQAVPGSRGTPKEVCSHQGEGIELTQHPSFQGVWQSHVCRRS